MSTEKTEKPTQKKVRDSRKKGLVAKSNELPSFGQLSVLLICLYFFGKSVVIGLCGLIRVSISGGTLPAGEAVDRFFRDAIFILVHTVIFPDMLFIIVTIIAVISQTGFLLASEAIKINTEKLNPAKNIKNIFSIKSLGELLKNMVKFFVISIAFGYLISHYSSSLQYLPSLPEADEIRVILQLIYWLMGTLCICTLFFFLADYAFQRKEILKQIMMSREDIKHEMKDSEGNPEIKSHRQMIHREIQSGSLSAQVKKSSVVVRNPTHIAVGISYHENDSLLPVITFKAKESIAHHLVLIAENENIPIIEDITLARALFSDAKVNDYIPSHLFQAVAELLWIVKQLETSDNKNIN